MVNKEIKGMKLKENRRERQIQEEMIDAGYEVLSKGWPDFLCYRPKDGKVVFLEVKRKQIRPSKKMGLSKHQKRVHEILMALGLDVRVVYV